MSLLDIASWVLMSLGGLFCVIGAVGLLRMPTFFTRTHAASVIDTLGAGLIILGLMLQSGWSLATVKMLILGVLILFTSPTAGHSLANAAFRRGIKPGLHEEGESSSSPR